MKVSLRTRLLLGCLAGLGVLIAHGAAYLLAHDHAHTREVVLHDSGHGAPTPLIAFTMAVLVAGLSHLVTRQPGAGTGLLRRVGPTWGWLAALQLATFVALELAERALAGVGPMAVIGEPAVWLGLIAQLLVALLGALLLVPLVRFVDRLRLVHGLGAKAVRSFSLSPFVIQPRALLACGGIGLRGPPAP